MKITSRQTITTLLLGCLWLEILGIKASAAVLLYATDTTKRALFTLSITDGSASLVGPFGVAGNMADLSYDPRSDTLFGTTTGTDGLYSINRATGAASLIGPLGVTLMHSIAHDNINGILYGVSVFDSALYRISTTTGQAARVGPTGISPGSPDTIIGLTFNPVDNVLYGCMSGPSLKGGLYRIDTTTGYSTFLFSATTLSDLAFHPETGVLYGIDNGMGVSPDALYTIDLVRESTTLVGLTGLGNNLGLEFAPVPEPRTLTLLIGGGLCIRLLSLGVRRYPGHEA